MDIIIHLILIFGNLVLFPLSFFLKWGRRVKIILAIVFALQLSLLGAWWLEWIDLVRIDNQDRLHFLIFPPIIGILCFIASSIGIVAFRQKKTADRT